MNEQELLDLKEEIDEAKEKVSELKGEKQALVKRLKEDWNCDSIEDAEAQVEEMQANVERLSAEIKQGLEKLKEKYKNL